MGGHLGVARKGFTLIELLVVIAISAILAAILFSVFSQARDKARQKNCLSNAKQVGWAVMQYQLDNEELYPSVHDGIYLVLVLPYTRNSEMWRCPSFSGAYPLFCWGCYRAPGEPPPRIWILTGWAANADVFGGWDNWPPKSLVRVLEPAGTVLLAENDNWPPREGARNNPPNIIPWTGHITLSPCRIAAHATYHSRWNVQPTRRGGRLGAHHMDGLNLIFVDGHTKWQKIFPKDCFAWVPTMPAGVRKVTDPSTLGCNPMNTTGTGNSPTGQWCGSN